MTGRRPFSELTKTFAPGRKARVAAKVRVLKAQTPLAELRQARERSQKELARALKVGQPAVAKLERRADMYVSNSLRSAVRWRSPRAFPKARSASRTSAISKIQPRSSLATRNCHIKIASGISA